SIRRQLDEINTLRRRLGFLERVIGGIEALTDSVNERLSNRDEAVSGSESGDALRVFESFEEAMEALDAEGTGDADIDEQRTELNRLDLTLTKRPLGNVLEQQLAYLLEKH